MKKHILLLVSLLFSVSLFSAEKVTGYWQSIDDETGLVKSISVIYEYNGKVYGRLLVTYEDDGSLADQAALADKIVGDPPYVGLDFIWNLQDRGKKWSKGKILDPKPGKIYSCDMWIDKGKLVVKGKIGPFGRSQVWEPVKKSELPDFVKLPKTLKPQIPKVK